VRVDHWVENGLEVTTVLRSLAGQVIVHDQTRETALARLDAALAETRLDGIETNLAYLRQIVADDVFRGRPQIIPRI